jgi:hypothetical protein
MAVTINASTSSGVITTADNSGVLQLQTNSGQTALTIDTSQNVGIGTTSPKNNSGYTTLTINNASNGGVLELTNNNTTIGQIYNDASNVYINSASTKNIQLVATGAAYVSTTTNGVERMRIDSSGNVQIGNSGGSSKLNLFGDNCLSLYNTAATSAGGITAGSTLAITNYFATGSTITFGTNASGGGIVERMRIDSSGYVLINTASQLGGTNNQLNIRAADIANTAYGLAIQNAAASTGGRFINFVNSSNTTNGFVSQTNSTTVAYTTSSDYRLKENIQPLQNALTRVSLLKPVTFTWKESNDIGEGFIAHELAEVIPDAVCGSKDDIDDNGSPKYQGVDTSFLVATLTAAIQEQQTIINELKSRIEALEGAK